MNLIAVSQRVDVNDYNERRDAIDQKWIKFLTECKFIPILIPNNTEAAKNLVKSVNLSGILLTGGNDLFAYGGDSSERDEIETFLIEYSIKEKLPLLGVCRGMQMIQHYFGVNLQKIEGHVSQKHRIIMDQEYRQVNSFHKFGAMNSIQDLLIRARSDDGVVEAICHKQYPMQGIMWHPERENPFSNEDMNMVKECFNREFQYAK